MTKAKMWAAGLGTLATVIGSALSDDIWDVNDTTQVVVAVVGILGTMFAVYKTNNGPKVSVE